jgi:DNA polymerase (family 10)
MKVYELLFLFNKLNETLDIKSNNYRFIKIAYDNVTKKIKDLYPLNATITKSNIEQLKITDNMRQKLTDLLTNKIDASDKKHLDQSRLLQELTDIAGIGRLKAEKLINIGLTDIKQLNQKKWESLITDSTKLLLRNKPLKEIPNSVIAELEPSLISFTLAKTKLVGGFIRKKPFSKDIDVMIVSNDLNIINKYLKYMAGIFDYTQVYSQGPNKASVLIQSKSTYFKIDIFVSPIKYQYAMLLYAIGSKQFNIKMRGIAKRKGYILNQYGLFKMPVNDSSTPVKVKSEKDFFKILEMPYVIPKDR